MFRTQNLCTGSKNVFDSRQKHFLFPQHMFPAQLNWETFASATMFPSLARPLASTSGTAPTTSQIKNLIGQVRRNKRAARAARA